MKKLIVAAAVVCAAAMSQAATFSWQSAAQVYGPTVANLTTETSGSYGVGTATGDRMKAETTNNGVTWNYVMILTSGSDSETLTGTVTDYKSNKINQNVTTTTIDIPSDDSTKNIAWDIVITGTMTQDGKTWTYESDHITGNGDFTSLSERKFTTGGPTGWTITAPTSPVPEPTSGLLMLLGVAGLALKRKRA